MLDLKSSVNDEFEPLNLGSNTYHPNAVNQLFSIRELHCVLRVSNFTSSERGPKASAVNHKPHVQLAGKYIGINERCNPEVNKPSQLQLWLHKLLPVINQNQWQGTSWTQIYTPPIFPKIAPSLITFVYILFIFNKVKQNICVEILLNGNIRAMKAALVRNYFFMRYTFICPPTLSLSCSAIFDQIKQEFSSEGWITYI